jgi:hypothetical protein
MYSKWRSSKEFSCCCCNLPTTTSFWTASTSSGMFPIIRFSVSSFSYCSLIDAAHLYTRLRSSQRNELDGTPRGSSGHSNQPHHDGNPNDAAWFLLLLSCCKLFDVINYYLMSVILMFIAWICAWDGSNFCFKIKKIDNFHWPDHSWQKLLDGNFRRLTIANKSYSSNFCWLMV